ncbi:MAG: substrate-binding domain-containing protein [Chloroflexota bacterium]|nr:substrate-binding domain-containing protein [Chloroflexota bacterium]MDE2894573.1 substrate-binding domain-containing protein [Chloroflexota bacterium]
MKSIRQRLPVLLALGLAIALTVFISHSLFHDATAEQESDGATVRISALTSESGSIRVALQQQGAGGSWGERQHPDLNTVPATAPTGVWLNSSPILLEGPSAAGGPLFCIAAHGARSDFFWRLLRGFSRQAALDLGMQVRFTHSTTGEEQADEIARCSAHGAAVIASTLAAPDEVGPALRSAKKAGARIVTFNSGPELAASAGSELHIALDDAAAGRLAGEEFNRRGFSGRIACLLHETVNVGLETRCDQLEATYTGGEVERLPLPAGADAEAVRPTISARLLDTEQAPLEAMLALNGDTLVSALQSIAETKDELDVIVKVASIGSNISVQMLSYDIRETHWEFFINAGAEAQGYLITAALSMVHTYTSDAAFIRQPLILAATPFVFDEQTVQRSPSEAMAALQRIQSRLALGEEYFE